ncbi:hypothetical protein F2P56_003944 [Juglans regia]|uniref:Uncharacterized protein LOC108997893 n=2 Tax=Juglans regia TaxID=51240 RepID=A0A2I4FDV1_JUGRE|nr:uncharacterized protein LOC108997893 [Juglans regia]KAF5477294.1 hypothetical protein F2P56_003944 [Juglans regia]
MSSSLPISFFFFKYNKKGYHANPRRVTSPVKNLEGNAKVAALMDPDLKRWNQELIQATFEEREAQLILETPISTMTTRDRIIWHGTKDGSFSVKSAYHLVKDREMANHGQASTSNGLKEVWKKIWKLDVTPGDKTFLWRACQEALPTQSNLFKKKVVSDPLCPICNREEESVQHVLWSCEAAKDVWSQCSKKLQKCSISSFSMITFFETLTEALNQEELQEFVITARRIWWRRNSFIFKKGFTHPNHIVREARATLNMMAEKNPDQCNTQASPTVIATLRQKEKLYPDPLLAESYGALQAVKLAREIGLHQVILEGDSLQVTKALVEDREALSSSSMFCSEARHFLKLFEKWEVTHVRRNGNHIAYLLAKNALSITDQIVTMEDTPSCIANFI